MLGNIGPLEILVVLIIALIVFGPKRLPELGSGLGRGIREFRDSLSGKHDDEEDEEDVKALSASPPPAPAPAAEERPAEPEAAPDKRR